MYLGWGDSVVSSAQLGADGEFEWANPARGSSSGQAPMELTSRQLKTAN